MAAVDAAAVVEDRVGFWSLLAEDQGNLGLLAGDEEALLRAYRRLDIPGRAALLHVVMRMAGPEPEPDAKPRRPGRG